MQSRPAATLAAFLFIALSAPVQVVRAQAAAPVVTLPAELTLSVGFAQDGRRDATVSPLAFDGSGLAAAVAYTRTIGPYAFAAWAGGGSRTMTPFPGPSTSSERLTDGELHVSLLRPAGARSSLARGLSVGAEFQASVALTEHRYDDPYLSVADFAFATGTLGPAASWREALGGGNILFHLATPLVAMVHHGYSDVKTDRSSPFDFRFATITKLQGANGAVSWTPDDGGRFGTRFTYRFGLLHYDDVQPVRSASQSLAAGVVARFGTGAR